jgi:hypothetical protein
VLVGRWLLSRKKLDQWEFQDPEMEVLYHKKTIYIYICWGHIHKNIAFTMAIGRRTRDLTKGVGYDHTCKPHRLSVDP